MGLLSETKLRATKENERVTNFQVLFLSFCRSNQLKASPTYSSARNATSSRVPLPLPALRRQSVLRVRGAPFQLGDGVKAQKGFSSRQALQGGQGQQQQQAGDVRPSEGPRPGGQRPAATFAIPTFLRTLLSRCWRLLQNSISSHFTGSAGSAGVETGR